MVQNKFEVVSIHYTTECNMNCPFCYKKRTDKNQEKPLDFWYDLVPYISKISNQIALGGGEPFTNLDFIKKFGEICKKNKVILNITSNGKILMDLDDSELKDVLKDVTMISLSFDTYKIKDYSDISYYFNLARRIKENTGCQVGCNLLVHDLYELSFVKLVDYLFDNGIDRVFALCPKNIPTNILNMKDAYIYLTEKYEHFYTDDLTRQIIEEGKYDNWCNECHYFKDIISINERGYVTGCSFDDENKALLKLERPEDILKITKIDAEKRFNCPYLIVKGGDKNGVKS